MGKMKNGRRRDEKWGDRNWIHVEQKVSVC
jgi:hypothetical protein